MLNQIRNSLRFVAVAIVSAMLCASAIAAEYPACPTPPQPAVWTGKPAIHLDRDIESCRLFLPYQWNELFGIVFYYWYGYTQRNLNDVIEKQGFRIEVTDRFMAGAPTRVVEFLNTDLNHYFLAVPDEAQAIEQGRAGIGWKRTGYGFTVRQVTYNPFPGKVMSPRSPISYDVHRFYGSIFPGPNSHFFTSDEGERGSLYLLAQKTPANEPRWNPEGIGFNVFRKNNLGGCADGLAPVWRAFNGGAARGLDPNHRYSNDKAVIDDMVRSGWVAEGVAFCVDGAQ